MENTKNKVWRFTNPVSAQRFADGCKKLHLVLYGDCPYYFVATFADAQRLVKSGYELLG
jgi:hypothetical protein